MKIFTLFFRPKVFAKMIEITSWTKSLDGVTTKYHKYGGIEFLVNEKEIFHMHGDGLIDVILTRELKTKFIENSEIESHHVNDSSSMISYQLTKGKDLDLIKEVILSSYENRILYKG